MIFKNDEYAFAKILFKIDTQKEFVKNFLYKFFDYKLVCSIPPTKSSGGSLKPLVKTKEYVSISPNIKRLVYKGARNAKYVKYKGKFERLSDVRRNLRKKTI
jgi:hypothetical protein